MSARKTKLCSPNNVDVSVLKTCSNKSGYRCTFIKMYARVVGWLILYHEVKETNTGVTCNYKVNDHEHSFNHRPKP